MSVVRNLIDDAGLAELMRAVQGGDSSAYRRLLADIVPRLRHLIKRRRPFLNSEDVEDLTQDVLLSLHAVIATYDPQRPFMPWLLAIMHNRMADAARRYVRRSSHEVQVAEVPVTFFDDPTNWTSEEHGDPEALRQAVAALPKAQREAVEMLKLRELSLKEASTQSGASIGALKVSAHRGMAALRKALARGQSR
ncbi:MAG: sigma-70 family RNA polymerase sigma factor [Xanthobacteraceae bacterium]|nr:sigma-70 family RNA polymerase sigma factor [Xanthobacteraceae bacterium]